MTTDGSRSQGDMFAPLPRFYTRRESTEQSTRITSVLQEGQHLESLYGSSAMLRSGSDQNPSTRLSDSSSEQGWRFILKPMGGVGTVNSSSFWLPTFRRKVLKPVTRHRRPRNSFR